MSEFKQDDEDKEPNEDSRHSQEGKKSPEKNGKHEPEESKPSDDDNDQKDRQASFFSSQHRESKRAPEAESIRNDEEKEKPVPKGLTETEAKEAVRAIADGLSREIRNEFDQASDSSVEELEAVIVAAFVDSLHEKLEDEDRDITEELIDEALQEALQDLLVDHESETNSINQDTDDGIGTHSQANNLDILQNIQLPSPEQTSSAISAFIASNTGTNMLLSNEAKRGRGLLIGGVVGYIIGRRHGGKRAEKKLRPEIEKLEDQVADLYEALASREYIIRQVVQELASMRLNEHELTTPNTDRLAKLNTKRNEASKNINPPSLVIPVVFASILATYRLKADVSNEQNTWGKDMLVGGVAGYMIGRRHGRKLTEMRLKSEMEVLEDRVSSLQTDLVNQDSVIDAMLEVAATADSNTIEQQAVPKTANTQSGGVMAARGRNKPDKAANQHNPKSRSQPGNLEQFVDASIDRIAASRKSREIQKHKRHLMKSGSASAIGEFNLASSVFMERRLIDGTENSPERKPIEAMNETELLAMSQDIYVDGESAIDLYDKGRIELETLRESVKQFWRQTGDYEQTIRANLKKDESDISNIRADLEKAYRSILENTPG